MKFREKDWTLILQRMGPVAPKMERIGAHAPSNLITLSEAEGGKRIWTFDCNLVVGERDLPALIDLSPREVIRTSRPWKVFVHKGSGFCSSSFESPVGSLIARDRPLQGVVQISLSNEDRAGPRALQPLLWWEERDTMFSVEWHTPDMIMPAAELGTDGDSYWGPTLPTLDQVRRVTTPFFRYLGSRGITHFRTGPHWSQLQPDGPNGGYASFWMDVYLEVLHAARLFGLSNLCGMGYAPGWAKPEDPDREGRETCGIAESHYSDFLDYVDYVLQNVAQGPKPLVEFVEILNEPNLAEFWDGVDRGDPRGWQCIECAKGGTTEDSFAKYIDLLAESYQRIRGQNGDGYPHLIVCNGGLFSCWNTNNQPQRDCEVFLENALAMLRDRMQAGNCRIMDAASIHTYGMEYAPPYDPASGDVSKDPIGPRKKTTREIGFDYGVPIRPRLAMPPPPPWSDEQIKDEMREYIRRAASALGGGFSDMAILCNEFGYSSLLNRVVKTPPLIDTRDPLTHWSSLYRQSEDDNGVQNPTAEQQQREQAFLNATAVGELLSSTAGTGLLPGRVTMVSLFVLYTGAGGDLTGGAFAPSRAFGNMSLLDRTFLSSEEAPDRGDSRNWRFGCNPFDFGRPFDFKVWGCSCSQEERISRWSAPGCCGFRPGEERQFERYAMKVLGAQAFLLANKRFCASDSSLVRTSGSSKTSSSAGKDAQTRVVAESGVHVRSFVRKSPPEFFTHQIRAKPLDVNRRVEEIRIGRAIMADVYKLDGTAFGANVSWDPSLGEWKVRVDAQLADKELFLFSEVYRPSILAAGAWCDSNGGSDTTVVCAIIHDPTGGMSLSVRGWTGEQYRFLKTGNDPVEWPRLMPGEWPQLEVQGPGIELANITPWGDDLFLALQSFPGRYDSKDFILLADNGVADNTPLSRNRYSDPWPFFATRPFNKVYALQPPPEPPVFKCLPSLLPGGLVRTLQHGGTFGMDLRPVSKIPEPFRPKLLVYGWHNTNIWQGAAGRVTAVVAAYLPERVPRDFRVFTRDEAGNVLYLDYVFPDRGYPDVFWFASSFDVPEGLLNKSFYTAEFSLVEAKPLPPPIPVRG